MLIKLNKLKKARNLLFGSFILSALCSFEMAIAREAMMAPKAVKSLLLDVAKAGSRLVAVGERGHILVSDDNGQTWQQKPVPVNQMFNAVHFSSE